jgi:hypothetical protein
MLLPVSANKLELLTAALSLIFLIKPCAFPSIFYTSKQTLTNNGTAAATDYKMQVILT